MTDRITVLVTFLPKPGKENEVEQVLRDMIAPTRAEAGCARYEFYAGTGPTCSFHLFEIYSNQAALDFHRTTAHYKTFRARIPDLLLEPIKGQPLRSLDVPS